MWQLRRLYIMLPSYVCIELSKNINSLEKEWRNVVFIGLRGESEQRKVRDKMVTHSNQHEYQKRGTDQLA
jgi:hypothetical protein